MPRYANALWMPNTNCFVGRDGQRPRYVIIHATAGGTSAQNIATYFQSTQGTNNPVSANYVDGQDGTIVCCNDENDGAWSNGYLSAGHDSWWDTGINPNNLTISIEVVKADLFNADAPTPAQLASLIKLVGDICNRWGIPKRWADASGGITGHFSVDPVNRQHCPGNFAWDSFFAALNSGNSSTQQGGGTMSGVPTGWRDDGKVLTAPNGIPVTQGFRDYVLAHNWDANNLPLIPAQGLTPLELGNPGLGSGTRQIFRWTMLEWTSTRGVFEAWTGQELVATINALHDIQAKYQKLADAWNVVVPEKNALIAERDQLKTQLAQATTELAQLKAQPGNTEELQQLQQQIDSLTKQVQAATAQNTTLANKLAQINILSEAS